MSTPRDPGWKNLTYPTGALTVEQIKKIQQAKKQRETHDQGRGRRGHHHGTNA